MTSITLHPLTHPVNATVPVPGSKSYTIRALLLAALTPTPVTIVNPLMADDTLATLHCLHQFGIDLQMLGDRIQVNGSIADIADREYILNAHLSAATLRFLLAMCCIIPGIQILHGEAGLNKRPVSELVDALRQLGANIEFLENEGYPPVRIASGTLRSGTVQVSGEISSQYISALMMIAPLIGELTIEMTGQPISRPYMTMTQDIMDAFGVHVEMQQNRIVIGANQQYRTEAYTVETDLSSAAYFCAIAALTKSTIRIPHINPGTAQADWGFVEILLRMGNGIALDGDALVFEGRGIQPLQVDMRDCPDQAQTLAVLAAFADGETRIDGLQSLRIKETDRLAALERELTRMGIRVETEPAAIVVHGGQPNAATLETYGDHRMAMAFAVAGVQLSGLQVQDPDVVDKTYPGFWQALQRLGMVQADVKKIILIGFMGAGKSSVAPLLAEKLGYAAVEMDARILQQSGRESINDIFERDGEIRFRELEIQVAKQLRHAENVVVSTGGGIVMNPLALETLRENGHVVFLETGYEAVLNRVGHCTTRPLLQDKTRTEALYRLRQPLYRQAADGTISTDDQTIAESVDAIVAQLPAEVLQGARA